jgi:hypothetical protein
MYMNDRLFKQHLSKIARWFTPIINEYSHTKKPAVNANPESINPTLGPIIEELTTPPSPCDWCGKIVNQEASHQRVLPRENEPPRTKSIWVSHCGTCGLYKNPVTEKMQNYYPKEVPTTSTWSKKRRDNFLRNKR